MCNILSYVHNERSEELYIITFIWLNLLIWWYFKVCRTLTSVTLLRRQRTVCCCMNYIIILLYSSLHPWQTQYWKIIIIIEARCWTTCRSCWERSWKMPKKLWGYGKAVLYSGFLQLQWRHRYMCIKSSSSPTILPSQALYSNWKQNASVAVFTVFGATMLLGVWPIHHALAPLGTSGCEQCAGGSRISVTRGARRMAVCPGGGGQQGGVGRLVQAVVG